jgi:hypothetical protein
MRGLLLVYYPLTLTLSQGEGIERNLKVKI